MIRREEKVPSGYSCNRGYGIDLSGQILTKKEELWILAVSNA